MTKVIDVQQYLDEDGLIDEVTVTDLAFAVFVTAVIESVTANYRLPLTLADAECLNIRNDELCHGEVEVWIYADSYFIGWECVECAETGAVSNWEGTRWDMRDDNNH